MFFSVGLRLAVTVWKLPEADRDFVLGLEPWLYDGVERDLQRLGEDRFLDRWDILKLDVEYCKNF